MADGQAPLIAAVSGKSPERVLAWSDPGTFTLRSKNKVESVSIPRLVPIDPRFLMEGCSPEGDE